MEITMGIAFLAGLVSFLSPCVLPIVPSYVTFVSGLTLDELRAADAQAARRQAVVHATLFISGFSVLFILLGAGASALGSTLRESLPLLQRIGGVVIILFGLHMLGILRASMLMRERRVQLQRKPAGKLGSVAAGVAFGAGWTPCIGPVLASILLYAGMDATMGEGMLLLAAYALGLGVPFFAAAVAFNWFLTGSRRVLRHVGTLEKAAGGLLVLVGVLLVTGQFAALTNFFAGFGQLINLEIG